MKRLTILTILTITLAAVFIATASKAQKVFSEGKITYDINVDVPPAQQQMAGMFKGSTMVLTIRNYMTRSDMHTSVLNNSTIVNTRENTAVSLMDNGGNKYLIRMSKEDLDKQREKYDGVSFIPQEGSKQIAGYSCRQAEGKLKDGSTFTVYYTPDLMPENTNYNKQFTGLKGLPLQYEMTMRNGLKMTLTANNVDLSPVPASQFDIPKSGYRELTMEEVRQMLSNH